MTSESSRYPPEARICRTIDSPILRSCPVVSAACGLPAPAVEQMEWNIRQVLSQDTAAISTLRCLKLFLEQFHIRSAVLNAELPFRSRMNIIEQYNVGNFDFLIATDASADAGGAKKDPSKDGGDEEEADGRGEGDPAVVLRNPADRRPGDRRNPA